MKPTGFRLLVVASALSVALASPTIAQRNRGLELGMDAGLFHYAYSLSPGDRSSSTTTFDIPVQAIRIAFPSDGPFELETDGGLTYVSSSGHSSTAFVADMALLLELSHDRKEAQWFVRPAVGVQLASSSSTSSVSRLTLGAGIGVREPITDRIAARFEARYSYWTKSQNYSANVIGLLAGLSVFTR